MTKKLLILFLFLGNSLIFLLKQPLTGDGLFTASLVRLPFKEMWTYIIGDFHPPLYYFSLALFARIFGFNDLVLRLFSIIFGLLAIAIFYIFLKETFDESIAFFSSLVLVFLPNFIFSSREPRMYPMFLFLVILSFFFFNRLLKEKSILLISGFTLSLLLLLYSHNWGLIVFFYLLAFTIISGNFKKFLTPFTLSFIGYLPWLPIFLNQLTLKTALGRSWGLPVENFWPRLWGAFLWNYNLLELPYIFWLVASLSAFFSILFLLLHCFRKKELLYLNLLLPSNILLFYLLTFREPFLTFSHISYLVPFYALGLGKGLNSFKNKNLSYAILITFTGLLFLFNVFHHYLPPISGTRTAQLFIKDQNQPGVLVFLTPYEALRMSWYLNSSPHQFITLSQDELPLFVMKDKLADQAVSALNELKEQHHGWVFYTGINIHRKDRASIYDPQIRIKNWLEKNSVRKIPFGADTPYPVYLYEF
ncbi:MAG: hypothetical protein DDT41_01096 [candidate division WS2 bacterium]|nr:hypothetical protein [Candidatus Psychracetigena formicireducens]